MKPIFTYAELSKLGLVFRGVKVAWVVKMKEIRKLRKLIQKSRAS